MTSIKLLLQTLILCVFSTSAFAQNAQLLLGLKSQYNMRSTREMTFTHINYFDLKPKNSMGGMLNIDLVYRPHKNYFVGSGISFGVNSYVYDVNTDFSKYGYDVKSLLPNQSYSYGVFGTTLNTGYSFNHDNFILDLGLGIISEPGFDNYTFRSGIYLRDYNGASYKAISTDIQLGKRGALYQNIFARFFYKKSKYELVNNLAFGLGYQTQFFKRFSSPIAVETTFTNISGLEFINTHRDSHNAFYCTFQYCF